MFCVRLRKKTNNTVLELSPQRDCTVYNIVFNVLYDPLFLYRKRREYYSMVTEVLRQKKENILRRNMLLEASQDSSF